jgi:hypothetical protein
MTTIDNLLTKIISFNLPYLESKLNRRDCDVLKSLNSNIVGHLFITENQGKLLTKILRENSKNLPDLGEEIISTLSDNLWSKPFRHIEQVKKLYLAKDLDDELVVNIEFTFNSQIRKILGQESKNIENLVQSATGKLYTADLTEKNIVALYELLAPLGFEIDEIIKNHYNTIKSWSEQAILDQFLLTSITHQNFQKHITADLGLNTAIDKNIINDRSVRYQYFTENPKNPGENLVEYIANRPKSKVWVDKKQFSLTDIFMALKQLRRLPCLVVFDVTDDEKTSKNLEILTTALENCDLDHNVGIYFRLSNTDNGKNFNQSISDKNYNKQLSDRTEIVGVQNGKIPKFFLKNAWRPMSVISLDNRIGLRHGKTAVYSNCCDLIIEWADELTLIEKRFIL